MKDGNALRKSIAPRQVWRRNGLVQPFLKWAGGKRQLLSEIKKLLPGDGFKRYFEPFVGAGAVVFDLQHRNVVINDFNVELINCYQTIKDHPAALIKEAQRYPHTKDEFYRLRALDRTSEFQELSKVERAARIIYLNKTCFNGLFRVNSRGEFNVPFGDYTNPKIIDEEVIQSISRYFNAVKIEILQGDFVDAVKGAKRGDFVYFDPPYDPISDTASFTGYSLNSFNRDDQTRLKKLCDELTDRGCKVLSSNSSTEFVRDLYNEKHFSIIEVEASRNINSVGSGRSKISELLIFNNYDVKSQ